MIPIPPYHEPWDIRPLKPSHSHKTANDSPSPRRHGQLDMTAFLNSMCMLMRPGTGSADFPVCCIASRSAGPTGSRSLSCLPSFAGGRSSARSVLECGSPLPLLRTTLRPLKPSYFCKAANDSPSPGGEGRDEGERTLFLRELESTLAHHSGYANLQWEMI